MELVPHSPEILSEALEKTQSIQDEYTRASILRTGVLTASEEHLEQFIKPILDIPDKYSKAHALGGLLSRLNPDSIDFLLWCDIMHTLAYQNRQDWLRTFPEMIPIIVALGGEEALEESVCNLQIICKQWR
ncbi:MAG: hypothetical protein F6K11_18960 [Leptolyngbya sp. SIO3F4]|nr:hypothetical protein [Leptolyngbya sp. SIO3F4]